MIIQLVALAIFLVSALWIVLIIYKKIPILVQLSERGHHGFTAPKVITDVKRKIQDKHFHFFQKQMLLHKILSKSRLLILKVERKIDLILSSIRKKAQELDHKAQKKK